MSEKRKQQNPNKVINTIKTLEYIRNCPGENVATISYVTKIALPTLYRAINTLVEKKIIVQDGQDASFAGRRANLYSVNSSYAYMLGIILDKRNVSAFVAGLDGAVMNKYDIDLEVDLTREQIISKMDKTINTVIKQSFGNTSGMNNIHKVGVLAASSIDVEKGTLEKFGGRECLNGFEIVKHIEKKYGKHAKLMKTSEAEAISFIDAMDSKGTSEYLYVHLGQGIAACLVMSGRVYGGKHGKAGEIQKVFDPKSLVMASEKDIPYTYLDICDAVKQYAENNPESLISEVVRGNSQKFLSEHKLMMCSLDEAIARNDRDAIALIVPTIRYWAMIINILSKCYDPGVCIIGGDFTTDVKNIYQLLKESVHKQTDMELVFADTEMTGEAALAKAVISDVFAEIENEMITEG